MGYSLIFDDFLLLARKHFWFLTTEGFVEKTFDKTQSSYTLVYANLDLLIRINYSPKSEFIEISFHKEFDKWGQRSSENGSTLDVTLYFAARKYPGEFYIAIMPKTIGFEPSIKAISYIVQKLLMPIIKGEEWITNKMILDGFRY